MAPQINKRVAQLGEVACGSEQGQGHVAPLLDVAGQPSDDVLVPRERHAKQVEWDLAEVAFGALVGLEVKLPTICRDGKAEVVRVSEEKSRSEKLRDGKSQKKEDAGARKGRKVAIHCVFPMIWGSGRSKSNLAKAAGCGASWPDER